MIKMDVNDQIISSFGPYGYYKIIIKDKTLILTKDGHLIIENIIPNKYSFEIYFCKILSNFNGKFSDGSTTLCIIFSFMMNSIKVHINYLNQLTNRTRLNLLRSVNILKSSINKHYESFLSLLLKCKAIKNVNYNSFIIELCNNLLNSASSKAIGANISSIIVMIQTKHHILIFNFSLFIFPKLSNVSNLY